jgi:hypothetical protein
LSDVRHELATDERLLRFQVSKSRETAKVKQWRIFRKFAEPLDAKLYQECMRDGENAAAGEQPAAAVPSGQAAFDYPYDVGSHR